MVALHVKQKGCAVSRLNFSYNLAFGSFISTEFPYNDQKVLEKRFSCEQIKSKLILKNIKKLLTGKK